MAETTPTEAELHSIVVIGAMNPRLHHPLWYQGLGLISDEETQAALSSPSLVVTSGFAQMGVPSFTIACQETRWEIRTADPSQRARMLEIADKVFKRLNETPVTLFGLNTKRNVRTDFSDVRERLVSLVASLGLGFESGGTRHCGLTFSNRYEHGSVNVEVSPSPLADDMIFVAYNTEYRPPNAGYFDLGDLVREHFEPDYQRAIEAQNRIVDGLARKGGM